MTDSGTEGRDVSGKFVVGNTIGKGNPNLRRQAALSAAVRAAVDEQDLAEVMSALLDKAIGGDTQAATLLLNYCCGKPRETPREPVAIDVGDGTAAGIAASLVRLAAAASSGDADPEAAAEIAKLLAVAGVAGVWRDLADRVDAIEQQRGISK